MYFQFNVFPHSELFSLFCLMSRVMDTVRNYVENLDGGVEKTASGRIRTRDLQISWPAPHFQFILVSLGFSMTAHNLHSIMALC